MRYARVPTDPLWESLLLVPEIMGFMSLEVLIQQRERLFPGDITRILLNYKLKLHLARWAPCFKGLASRKSSCHLGRITSAHHQEQAELVLYNEERKKHICHPCNLLGYLLILLFSQF